MDSLTERIKAKARELGYCEVGIARAEYLKEEGDHLLEWLKKGYHGTMAWMARNVQKRIDPRAVLPDAQSVVAVAVNYYAPVSHSTDEREGKISRYAWGEDYHEILMGKLKQLLEFIKTLEPTAEGKVYVDTGPVLEKVWAQRAGIGWEGKHTNIISRQYGSWIFLGEIILNLQLDYDAPATDHCGTCTLCIEACPTGAIVEPYVLDSTRCISYLTIEHHGDLDDELVRKFDNWIYGCDICQDVCPWNKKFAKPTAIKQFYPRQQNVAPVLEEVARLRPGEFAEQFRNSPVKRAGHTGLTRNAKAVLSGKAITV